MTAAGRAVTNQYQVPVLFVLIMGWIFDLLLQLAILQGRRWKENVQVKK